MNAATKWMKALYELHKAGRAKKPKGYKQQFAKFVDDTLIKPTSKK